MPAKPPPPPHWSDANDANDANDDDDDLLEDRGRSLGMRLLALLGAFSFLMLGVSTMAPLLHPAPPQEMPDQRRNPVGWMPGSGFVRGLRGLT